MKLLLMRIMPLQMNLNEAVVDIDSDNEDNFLMSTFYKPSQTQSQPQPQSQSQTPLQPEVARYMSNRDAADRPEKGTPAFDVLGWWSAHEKIFPLMSKATKKYLAIQATLCVSERTFSTGGATVPRGPSSTLQMSTTLCTARIKCPSSSLSGWDWRLKSLERCGTVSKWRWRTKLISNL